MSVGNLEEIIDEKSVICCRAIVLNVQHIPHACTDLCFDCSHAIVSSSVGPEYYVSVLSFVDKTQLEPGCSVLMHNKVRCCH